MDLSRQAFYEHIPEKFAPCKHPTQNLLSRYSTLLRICKQILLGCVLDQCIPFIHAADLTWLAPPGSQIPIHLDQKQHQNLIPAFLLLSWRLPFFAISAGQELAAISNPRHHERFSNFRTGQTNKHLKPIHRILVVGQVNTTLVT